MESYLYLEDMDDFWPEEKEYGGDMDNLEQRVERLEKDTQQIKLDLAVLTSRSENFATKADVAELKAELVQEIVASEVRTNAKFERIDEKFQRIDEKFERIDKRFDDLNNRILWTLMVPALTAILLWFVKTAILKI
ncbi:hypothetical protein [Erwinia phyllosphaerae]|uniref:hypothetical protein n=1 Tax=Erwinia phyllosphaerae TaxID=2853256 RepID=UPI001FEF551D|nr:hypothetical protein [Erwinia phyllosphaerae]